MQGRPWLLFVAGLTTAFVVALNAVPGVLCLASSCGAAAAEPVLRRIDAAAEADSAPDVAPDLSATLAAADATSDRGPSRDPRFGVAVQYAVDEAAIARALDQTGSSAWYTWGPPDPAGPNGRVQLVNTGPHALTSTQEQSLPLVARARPGSYWIVGSEPNVPGQGFDQSKTLEDNAAEYAATFRRYRSIVLAADPTARFVVGNTLNLDANCGGCAGYPPGRRYLDAFVAAYGEPIPPDTVWGIHTYRMDWTSLPMVDAEEPIREIAAFRAYLDTLPGQAAKPIWITEIGVVWAYTSFCVSGEKIAPCDAPYAEEGVDRFLTTTLGWLTANADAMRIERWFVFSTYSQPEVYAEVPGGIALMDGPTASAELTRFGRIVAGFTRRA